MAVRRRGFSGLSSPRDIQTTLQYHLSRKHQRVELSATLPFDDEANRYFINLVSSSASYLEYGAGASTLNACPRVHEFVTVESDKHFLKAIRDACLLQYPDDRNADAIRFFIHADIGPTGTWGKPLLPSFPRPSRWKRYAIAPWADLGQGFRADVILIDGRFRVACALTVALQQPDTHWSLMFDDYTERREYWATEDFLRIKRLCGRMAVFEPLPSMDREAALLALEHYSRDWR